MTKRHEYPADYAPGPDQHWAINAAWEIVDHVAPGVLSPEARELITGMIAGKLVKAYGMGQRGEGPPYSNTFAPAVGAPKSKG